MSYGGTETHLSSGCSLTIRSKLKAGACGDCRSMQTDCNVTLMSSDFMKLGVRSQLRLRVFFHKCVSIAGNNLTLSSAPEHAKIHHGWCTNAPDVQVSCAVGEAFMVLTDAYFKGVCSSFSDLMPPLEWTWKETTRHPPARAGSKPWAARQNGKVSHFCRSALQGRFFSMLQNRFLHRPGGTCFALLLHYTKHLVIVILRCVERSSS